MNNIFNFATSELSQDAFICWSINWLTQNDDLEARTYSFDFVNWLCGEDIDLSSNLKVEVDGIIQQYYFSNKRRYHVDVVVKLSDGSRKILLVMENKTNTTHHSNQLEEYKSHFISATEYKDYEKLFIYFKTGLITTVDKSAANAGYRILSRTDLVTLLKKQKWNNSILNEFREYLVRIENEWTQNLELLFKCNDVSMLKYSYCQWALIEEVNERTQSLDPKGYWPYNGTSSGRPWTQLPIIQIQDLYPHKGTGNPKTETIFYRIDRRKKGYYLAVRHYADVSKECQATKIIKKERAEFCKRVWNKLREEGNYGLDFSHPSSGTSEDEITTIFFDNERNTIDNVLKTIPTIHKEYCESLTREGFIENAKENVQYRWNEETGK